MIQLHLAHGDYQATRRVNELEEHKDVNCKENLTSKELDGDEDTGHKHDETNIQNQNSLDTIAERIYNSDDEISSAFSEKDIKNMLAHEIEKHPDYSLDQIESTVTKDCEQYIDSINRRR